MTQLPPRHWAEPLERPAGTLHLDQPRRGAAFECDEVSVAETAGGTNNEPVVGFEKRLESTLAVKSASRHLRALSPACSRTYVRARRSCGAPTVVFAWQWQVSVKCKLRQRQRGQT
jgi:hypothetical protein